MNWCGGNLVKFKRKNLSKKAEERVRIEDYIRKRQHEKQMEALGLRGQIPSSAGGRATTSATDMMISTTSHTNSIRDRVNRKLSMNETLFQAKLNQRKPAYEYFKRPLPSPVNVDKTAALSAANPSADIDPNFLKPKIFPAYLRLTPKLFFDFGEGTYTTKDGK